MRNGLSNTIDVSDNKYPINHQGKRRAEQTNKSTNHRFIRFTFATTTHKRTQYNNSKLISTRDLLFERETIKQTMADN